jgi:L-amino acid N-acyltransferase YncA
VVEEPAQPCVEKGRQARLETSVSKPGIRLLAEADWPQVHELVVEVASAGETYAMDVPRSEAETRDFWEGQHVVVSVEGDNVLGSAKMGPNRPAQGSHVGTASFMVGSAARGGGIGRALGEYAVEWHRANGFAAIQFNAVVSTNNDAIALWHSLGFETVGTVPGAFRLPDSSYADLHVMYLRLEDA